MGTVGVLSSLGPTLLISRAWVRGFQGQDLLVSQFLLLMASKLGLVFVAEFGQNFLPSVVADFCFVLEHYSGTKLLLPLSRMRQYLLLHIPSEADLFLIPVGKWEH